MDGFKKSFFFSAIRIRERLCILFDDEVMFIFKVDGVNVAVVVVLLQL